MLVLSRRVGESIHIGDNVVVTVVSVQGSRIKLGVKAPREVSVLRSELAGQSVAARPSCVEPAETRELVTVETAGSL